MALMFRAAAMAGALLGTTFIASPAAAAPLSSAPAFGAPQSVLAASRYNPADAIADWRCRGWGCGRRGWRRDRVDAGDVILGAAVIGGLAAILSSNNRRARDRDVVIVERDRDFRERADPEFRRDDRRSAPRGSGASGLDNAVSMCLDRIERDVRVDAVDNVQRTGAGWQVTGSLFNGTGFTCRIGNDGRIDTVDYAGSYGAGDWRGDDRQAAAAVPAPGQWDDSRYASARASVGGTVRPDIAVSEADMNAPVDIQRRAASTAMPAYPGGPIPGEVIPETIDEDIGG